jgi:hypothetical protein
MHAAPRCAAHLHELLVEAHAQLALGVLRLNDAVERDVV